MRDANDYRGVTAEAKQTIYPHEIPDGFRLGGEKYTSSYVRRGFSMEYEDPPKTQQQPILIYAMPLLLENGWFLHHMFLLAQLQFSSARQ